MKKILFTSVLLIISVITTYAQTTDTETQATLPPQTVMAGTFSIQVPPGMLISAQGANATNAMLPDGSIGLRLEAQDVKANDKEIRAVVGEIARQINMPTENLQQIDLGGGVKGWMSSGKKDQFIITIAVVGYDAKILRALIMETETLTPRGPELVRTITANR